MNYENAKIYFIFDNTNGDIYINWSCCINENQILYNHLSRYHLYLMGNLRYHTVFDILKNKNYDLYIVEDYPCRSRFEIHSRYRFYIRNTPCINRVNKKKFILKDLKPKLHSKTYSRNYYLNNREAILKDSKERHSKKKVIKKEKLIIDQEELLRIRRWKRNNHPNKDTINAKRREEYKIKIKTHNYYKKKNIIKNMKEEEDYSDAMYNYLKAEVESGMTEPPKI